PPTTIPALGGRRCRATGRIAYGKRASLSVAAGALDRHQCRRWLARHHRTSDGSMAVGAKGTADRRRQPSGRAGREHAENMLESTPSFPAIFFAAIIGVIVFIALSELLLDPHE